MTESLFDSIAHFYDIEVRDLVKFKDDVPLYLEYARKVGGETLELACGTGRVLIPLAKDGITVTGLDASRNMLEQAQKKIDVLPGNVQKRIRLVHQDMTKFHLDHKFNMIFCAFRSFQHLVTKQEQGECLVRIREHLNSNGTFVVHLFAPLHHLLAKNQRTLYLGMFTEPRSGSSVSRRSEVIYDHANQTLHEDRFYEWVDKDGKFHQHVWSFDLACIYRFEFELLLEKYGFKVEQVYGDFKKSPYNYHSGEQIFVANKLPKRGWV